ncbi:Plastocyanin [Halogranum amylolyticum]|uniref:Plastocyanin n=1 Tax=Halogranum amylolyticum TaxID=660520 RepID=A0A1H8SP33_9EURY|nr:plastocyanin/azurin family copper-binding protein [Halogranum amylolyticum]SEO80078.1 Plastocyanin [Halogranum amylolyticum]
MESPTNESRRRASATASGTTRRAFLRGVTGGAAAAATVAGSAGSAAAQEDGGGTTHTVDMTDGLVFDPDELTIAPGDTVRWVNVGTVGHSVTAYEDEIPEDAEFFASGDFDGESAARGGYPQRGDVAGGEEYSHTFEVEGDYGYFCIPHESVGMIAELSVVAGGAQPEPAVDLPSVPDSARSLAVATTTAFVSVVALAYFFLKYGGDYGEQETGEESQSRR